MLNHLGAEDFAGILVEVTTDFCIVPTSGPLEMVSVKHRDVNQTSGSDWTWDSLRKQDVLTGLFKAWSVADEQCSVAFWTNAGFIRSLVPLHTACSTSAPILVEIVKKVAAELAVADPEARRFLAALKMPAEPLPRRKEITDIGVVKVGRYIRQWRTGAMGHAEAAYGALIEAIAAASTDLPDERAYIPIERVATLASEVARRGEWERETQFLSADNLRLAMLAAWDRSESDELQGAPRSSWTPDPLFIGREQVLHQVRDLLRIGEPVEVAPVVIHGGAGCGKTSVALQFAALSRDQIRPIIIDARSRASLLHGINSLSIPEAREISKDDALREMKAPVTPTLPGNSATLIILDGVTDVQTLRGVIPRIGLCRVLITSTVRNVDAGYMHIALDVWTRGESVNFIRNVFPSESFEVVQKLASVLHDHPLAITQAVNYCRNNGSPIIDFLERFNRMPVDLLDRGSASGYPRSLAQTLRLAIELLDETCSEAGEILRCLAFMDGHPFPESLFPDDPDRWGMAFVSRAEVVESRSESVGWIEKILRKRKTSERESQTRHAEVTVDAQAIASTLGRNEIRDRALEALVSSALVNRRDGALIMHPLIALYTRGLCSSPVPYLELGLGFFVGKMGGDNDYSGRPDPYLGIINAIVSHALERQLHGIGVILAGRTLVMRLALMGDGSVSGSVQSSAVELGRVLLSRTEMEVAIGALDAELVLAVREALAQALILDGAADEAIVELRKNYEFGASRGSYFHAIRSLLNIGLAAARGGLREVAEEALGLLPEPQTVQDDVGSATIAQMRAQLLRLLNRHDEADSALQVALERMPAVKEHPQLSEEIYGVAALLARDRNDDAAVFRYESLAAEAGEGRAGHLPRLLRVRHLADSAIGAGELEVAERYVAEAEQLAREGGGTSSAHYGDVLAVRGRLRFVQQRFPEASEDLEESLEIMQNARRGYDHELTPALVHLAQVRMFLGDFPGAISLAKQAVEIDTNTFGAKHPETLKDIRVLRQIQIARRIAGSLYPRS
ncbi:hypothetical protein OHA72_01365 [Dactylosporangium sp. NBC_01737]|uniref:tetratricopeptide repeat protein n=1 Tax=Dactylosporangium sp. NBC_01737 TaxID=2975959 RepID=UPI002E10BDB7|nr:hypothetical protein OHA72_01365 [Dactylosporangium sp. NBC_01737]